MRLKNLFTVPTGQKVTEKCLRRVLVSSICSILLCMTCLVSTTWAWFAVSIENTGNVIEIAEIMPTITVKNNNSDIIPADGIYTLNPGNYTVTIALEQAKASAYGSQPPVYVVMTVQESEGASQCYYFVFTDRAVLQTQEVTVNSSPATVSFSVSWVEPSNAAPVDSELVIGDAPATEPTTEPATEETTAPSGTEAATVPEEPSTPPTTDPSTATEKTTDFPTETTESPTEAATQPTTEPTGEPTTESTTEPTTELRA